MGSSTIIGQLVLCVVLLVPTFVPTLASSQQGPSEATRRVTNRVVPPYPDLARAMNVRGSVRLEVIVAANGTVKSLKVVGGHPVLAQAAERAVQKWQWERASHESSESVELRFNPD